MSVYPFLPSFFPNKPNPPSPKPLPFPSPPFSSPPASPCANPLAPHRSCPQKSTTLHSRHAAKLPRQRTFSDRLGGLSPQASGHHGLQNRAKTNPDPRTPMVPKILAFRTGAPRARPVVARFPVYQSGFRRLRGRSGHRPRVLHTFALPLPMACFSPFKNPSQKSTKIVSNAVTKEEMPARHDRQPRDPTRSDPTQPDTTLRSAITVAGRRVAVFGVAHREQRTPPGISPSRSRGPKTKRPQTKRTPLDREAARREVRTYLH